MSHSMIPCPLNPDRYVTKATTYSSEKVIWYSLQGLTFGGVKAL